MILLKDVGNITMGQSPKSETYNTIGEGLPFFQGKADFGILHPKKRIWCTASKKEAHKNDLLISVRAPVGALNIALDECSIGRGLAAISINANNDTKYIYYNLCYLKPQLQQQSTGSTFDAINKAKLEKLVIKKRSLSEQVKIRRILDSLSEQIQIKLELLNHYDMLIKSRFEEMFGDFSYLQKEMKKDLLSDYLVFLTSGPRGWAKYYSNDGSLFITIKNLVNHQIDINDVQYIDPPDSAESKRTRLLARDLLISITADLGRTAVVTKEIEEAGGYINQHIALMRLDLDLVNPVFLSYCLESDYCKRQIIKSNQNGVKAGLNFKALKNLSIVIPKIELQNKFEEFVIQINKLKFAIMVYN